MPAHFPVETDRILESVEQYRQLADIGGAVRHAPYYDHDGVIRVGLWASDITPRMLFRLAATQLDDSVDLTLQTHDGRPVGLPVYAEDEDPVAPGKILEGGSHEKLVIVVDLASATMLLFGQTDDQR